MPVFYRVVESLPDAACRNCADMGRVFISLAVSGPYKWYPDGSVATYYEGGPKIRKGWYVVETESHPCPSCQMIAKEETEEEVQQPIPF